MKQDLSIPAKSDDHSKVSAIPFDEVCDFVIELGEAAHRYGSSSLRLEVFLTSLMKYFGYSVNVYSTPNEIIFAFQKSKNKPQRIHILSSLSGGIELNKLARVGDLITNVVNGGINIKEASKELKQIRKITVPWGNLTNLFSYAAIGAGMAGVLMGSWTDIVVAIPISLLVYLLVIFSARFKRTGADWLPLISAFMVGLLAAVAKLGLTELNIVLVVVSSITILLPGYTISTGAMELLGGNMMSGNIKIINGIIQLVKQAIGAWLGVKMIASFANFSNLASPHPDIYWQYLFVPLLAIGLCLSFQTSKRDFLATFLACMIAYFVSLLGSNTLGAIAGTLLGTVAVVIFSNSWTSKTGRPTSIVLVPGIIMLVGGLAGFNGFVSLVEGKIQLGEHQIQHMFLIAITIGAGLVVGNTLSHPKVTL